MYIKVRVIAGAKKERIEEKDAETLLISVKEPAERNLANGRVLELLADWFKVRVQDVRLVSGHHSPSKIVSIPDQIFNDWREYLCPLGIKMEVPLWFELKKGTCR